MSSPLLAVRDLRVFYRTGASPVRAVDGVNLTVERKEILGIVGESGCGKSTLAMGILKLARPPCYVDGGEVVFDGINLLDLDEESLREMRLKRFTYVPQGSMNALNPIMRIEDQIVDGIIAHEDVTKEEAGKRVPALFKIVGLPPETARMYQHELSGGMRQRAAIAIALALYPDFIVADEPTTALDVVVQRAVLEYMVGFREQFGSSLMIITHDIAVTAEICDRLGVMYAGKIVETGSIYDMCDDPIHPYTKGLIAATPSLTQRRILSGLSGRPPNLINPPPGCRFAERCSFAEDNCEKEEPQLHEVNPRRFVACHLF